MALFLTHALDLAERLRARGRRAIWPLTFNLLAGELWFEVDRYEQAREAFERDIRASESPRALAGLAASLDRLGRHDESCRVLARVRGAGGPLGERVRAAMERCR